MVAACSSFTPSRRCGFEFSFVEIRSIDAPKRNLRVNGLIGARAAEH
jgi:hypothetical protein